MRESSPNGFPEKIIRRTMPELDTVRGVAILLVVFLHGFSESGVVGLSGLPRLFVIATRPGWMGVNLFFVLSGFLITGILLDSREKPHYYRDFYIRRALRILPVYYLLLVVLWLLPRLGLVDHRQVCWQFVGLSFIYLSNVTQLFGVPMQYGPLWSLAVEEHFYLLWPSAARLLSRTTLAWIAASIFFACPLFRAIAFGLKYEYNGYTWLVADGLAAGALLAIYCRRPGFERKDLRRISALSIGAALLLLAAGSPFSILHPGSFACGILRPTMLNFFFVGALSVTLLVGTSRWQSLVRRPILQFFGEISYGLYLIHMLVFDVFDHFASRYFPILSNTAITGHFALITLRFVLAGGIAVAIAFLSRRTLEARFLSLKDRWTGNRAGYSTHRQSSKNEALHVA